MGKIYFKILLMGFACILMASYTYPQVVQYEHKENIVNRRGKYHVLQVDYEKRRFVYRVSSDVLKAEGWEPGYIEMYGVFEENPGDPDTYDMEIYDWLHMRFSKFSNRFYPSTGMFTDSGENAKVVMHKFTDDSVWVGYGNSAEEEYPEFHAMFPDIFTIMKRVKKMKLDKKMFGKEMYKKIIHKNRNIIFDKDLFQPFDIRFTRIYRWEREIPDVKRD